MTGRLQRIARGPAALAGVLSFAVGVVLTVAPRSVLLFGAAGVFTAAIVVPIDVALGALLTVRNLSDPASASNAGRAASAGLNTSAAIGLLIIALAAAQWWRGRIATPPAAVLGFGVVLAALFGLAFLRFGPEPSILREIVRFGSIVVLGVLAASQGRSRADAERLLLLVLFAAMIPAVVAVLQGIGFLPTGSVGAGRARGTLAHPNTAATLFACCIPVAVWLGLAARSLAARRIAQAFVFLFGLALIATGGMGGLLQAGVGVLALAALMPLRARVRAGALATAVLLVVTFAVSPAGSTRVSELSTTQNPAVIAQSGVPSNSVDWRFYNWSVYLDVWRDRPVLGSGLGTTQELLTPLGGLSTHSDIIRTLVEAGIVGLGVFVFALVLLVRKLLRRARALPNSVAVPALAVMAGAVLHTIDSTITEATAPMYTIAVIVGIGVAPALRSDHEETGDAV